MDGKLPPISCKRLKYLTFEVSPHRREPIEPCPCDLSYLSHLQIYTYSGEVELSLMEAYNIGEILEFLHILGPRYS